MEFELLKIHVLRPTLSTSMVQRVFYGGRGKRGILAKKTKGPWQRNVDIINLMKVFFRGTEDKDKRMVKLDFSLEKCPF